ncbi:hypothetical protein NDU88_002474 [Pleurodeles waltl]|uniref:Amine oxidase n=1 Tax=Pleurodeles waltl TaxID=8319 RepID=A0AAV7QCR5_PLEWA|nr:hypothetical protein NDU88_002474 [Pleurodeles waltl]
MNLRTVLVLLALAWVTMLANFGTLVSGVKAKSQDGGAQKHSGQQEKQADQQEKLDGQGVIFSDLNPTELSEVVYYLQQNLGVGFVDAAEANPSDNCIYYVDVLLPKKQDALNFLDNRGPQPKREALAVVFFGNQQVPNITEYVIGPLPHPTYHSDITLQKYKDQLPYYRRPVIGKEYTEIYTLIYQKEFAKAPIFLKDAFDYDGTNFAALTTAPRGFQSGDRRTWFILFHNVSGSGFFLHPVGLEILVDHQSLDVSQWKAVKVFYKGKYFNDMVHLEEEHKAGKMMVEKMGKVPPEMDIASMIPLGDPTANTPFQYEPTGPRYSVKDNQVFFQSWSFAFGKHVNSGLLLFDVRFQGERVVYELSVQEAIAIYGSNAPGLLVTRYIDSSFSIGRFAHELVRGVDCPYQATYVDTHHMIESQSPKTVKNSICIFEQNAGIPLRRHYSNLHPKYYGGLPSTVLVIRAVSTLTNYDYVWDFMFYQNGVIEAKVSATGYICSSFLYADGLDFGSRVGEHTLGTLHTHFINYKVDLDIGGKFIPFTVFYHTFNSADLCLDDKCIRHLFCF